MKALFFTAWLVTTAALAGDPYVDKTPVPLEQDRWRFTLAVPGFLANIDGDAGIGRAISDIDVGFGAILPRIDMIWATRAEASKGRFGILGELIYLSMSDGVGKSGSVIKKVDARVDEYLTDFTLRWRIVEGERGFVDLLAGVRYTNLYQVVTLQANDERIQEVAEDFTDAVSVRLRERVEGILSEGRFRNAVATLVNERITNDLESVTGPEARDHETPNAPIAYREVGRIGTRIEDLVRRRAEEFVTRAATELRQAAAAEAAALRQAAEADRARLRARATALRSRVNNRIAAAQRELEREVERVLKKSLDRRYTRADDWLDPYIGIRARYNFSPKVYVIGRGDIGGFGVGSDLMWQAEAAIGFQLTPTRFVELGYRAISFDYEDDGLTYDVITHGVQLTLGVMF